MALLRIVALARGGPAVSGVSRDMVRRVRADASHWTGSVGTDKAFQGLSSQAVFLFNFAQFVEWPPSAFAGPTSPIVIGVLGENPFGTYLDETVRGEKVGKPAIRGPTL